MRLLAHARRARGARPQRGPPPACRGRDRRRDDGDARVGDPARHRGHPEPVGPDADAGRLVRRQRRRGRGRHGAVRARQRRRRLAAHPGGVLRTGRPQAAARARVARARDRGAVPRAGRRPHADRRRDRRAPRRPRRDRAGRRELGATAAGAVRRGGGARPRPPAHRDDLVALARRRPGRPRLRRGRHRDGAAAGRAGPRGRPCGPALGRRGAARPVRRALRARPSRRRSPPRACSPAASPPKRTWSR